MKDIIRKISYGLIVLTIFLFMSCEGFVEYTGTIYDAQTKEPIDNVLCVMVRFEERDMYTYSDSVGIYNISTPMVGCVPNCRDYDVKFSKQGYKTQIITAPSTVYLEKD